MVRSPCFHDLHVALEARRRLIGAVSQAQVSMMSHTECADMLLRVRQEHAALHSEHGPKRSVRSAIARFGGVERVILANRDRSAWLLLCRLLAKAGKGFGPSSAKFKVHTQQYSEPPKTSATVGLADCPQARHCLLLGGLEGSIPCKDRATLWTQECTSQTRGSQSVKSSLSLVDKCRNSDAKPMDSCGAQVDLRGAVMF